MAETFYALHFREAEEPKFLDSTPEHSITKRPTIQVQEQQNNSMPLSRLKNRATGQKEWTGEG